MARVHTLLLVGAACLVACRARPQAVPQPPVGKFLSLDALVERPEAWQPASDRLRPTVQAATTRGTPRALCFEVPTTLGPFKEDVFQNPQCPRRFLRLPDELDLARFTRLTVWAKETGRRATFIHVGLSSHQSVWGKGVVRTMACAPIDRGPWRRYVVNFHHMLPAERRRLRYLLVMSTCVGSQPDEEPVTRVFLDDWRLSDPPQRRTTGWGADPAVVTVSHAGFKRFAEKLAIVPAECPATDFAVHRVGRRKAAFAGKLEAIDGPLGRYGLARFDALTRPGRYIVSAGRLRSLPFRIADDVFDEPMHFVYSWLRDMRCGCTTRSHMPCHLDDAIWKGKHHDLSGGWHDAGDVRTYWIHSAQVPITALRLHRLGHRHDDDGDGRDDFLADAEWGARHLVKIYDALGWFPGKIRDWPDYRRGNYWTDNTVGTPDDRRVIETPMHLDTEGDVMTLAGLLPERCPPASRQLADRLLAIARKRFDHFWDPKAPKEKWRAHKVKDWHGYHWAHWARGMLWLHKATGERRYLDTAVHYAREILAMQRREWYKGATRPLCGEIFSWGARVRDRDLPEELLAALCDAFPDHPDWIAWHFALVRGVEHWHKPVRALWRPFSLPQLEQGERTIQHSVGVRISDAGPDSMYVVPCAGVSELPGTAGCLMRVARTLNDPALERLVTWQLQWALGHNPWNFTFITDYGPDCIRQHYSFSQGRLPGSVTVTFGMGDNGMPHHVRPYGSEVCVGPGRKLLEALGEIAAPASLGLRLLDGGGPYRARASVWWTRAEQRAASERTDRDGRLPAIRLPGGETYELRVPHPKGEFRLPLPLVSGKPYRMTLDLARHLILRSANAPAVVEAGKPFRVALTVANLGHGPASGVVRAFAADSRIASSPVQRITIPGRGERTLTWQLIAGEARRPYLLRFELDGDHARALDATGHIGPLP